MGLSNRVHLLGFLSSPDAWSTLGVADLFVCPSEAEPWGLVINEAVAAGLPVLASDQCGAAEDLVVRDRTGEIVPTGDVRAWEHALRQTNFPAFAPDFATIRIRRINAASMMMSTCFVLDLA